MNYEKIIVELLGRIQTLEEQVATLMKEKNSRAESKENEVKKITTEDIRQYIANEKAKARSVGKTAVILRSGDIHKDLGLKNALPQVCNAMRQSMEPSDAVLHTTPSGNSSTIEIEYRV
ncbi:MAG: hypothetical protein J6Q82_02155 [Clostridia bacterium]|nr:hypothetical protein [Clostridia bacterium]